MTKEKKETAMQQLRSCKTIEEWNETRNKVKHLFEVGEIGTFKQVTKQ